MAGKIPKSQAAVGVAATQWLIKYLRSEQGQAQLRKVPKLVRWVRDRRTGVIEVSGREVDGRGDERGGAHPHGVRGELAGPPHAPRLSLGSRGLERRVAGLRRGFALAFAEGTEARQHAETTLSGLQRSLAIGAGLPLAKRQRLYFQIGRQLGELEDGLFQAARHPA